MAPVEAVPQALTCTWEGTCNTTFLETCVTIVVLQYAYWLIQDNWYFVWQAFQSLTDVSCNNLEKRKVLRTKRKLQHGRGEQLGAFKGIKPCRYQNTGNVHSDDGQQIAWKNSIEYVLLASQNVANTELFYTSPLCYCCSKNNKIISLSHLCLVSLCFAMMWIPLLLDKSAKCQFEHVIYAAEYM